MGTLVRTSGIVLPKNHPDYNRITSDLNRTVSGWDNSLTHYVFYEDVGGGVLIPRFYPVADNVIDKSEDGLPIHIKSKIRPRNRRQEKAIEFFLQNRCGILSMDPGAGKTVVTIDAICRLGRKAIIFAHKDKLIEQWMDEILNHTEAMEDDIARLSYKTMKDDFQKPIVLSTIQTVLSMLRDPQKKREFRTEFVKARFGVAVFDECHTTVGPEKFTQVSLLINCYRVYGLSATPQRDKATEDIVYYHLGNVFEVPVEDDQLLKPKIYALMFPFGVYSKYAKYITWGRKFSTSRYYKQMVKSDRYIENVSRLIKRLYNDGRIILVLGVRVDTLMKLAEKSEIPKNDVGIFIPGTDEKQRLSVSDTADLTEAFRTKRVVFSTYLACRDGNNRPELDCLVMTVPTSNVKQAIGRVLRVKEGKPQPIVLDLIDTEGPMVYSKELKRKVPWFIRSFANRKVKYDEYGWECKPIKIKE